MKKQYISLATVLILSLVFSFVLFKTSITEKDLEADSNYKRGKDIVYNETSGPDKWAQQQYMMTRDPRTGEIPYHLLFEEYERMRNLKTVDPLDIFWQERGPNNVGGRTRALMWDPNDPFNLKFWAGGVSGGLWYTNDIEDPSTISWNRVEDIWENLSISFITYDPNNTQIFYAGTGEGWFTDRGIPGWGIWRSLDDRDIWCRSGQ